MKKAFNKYINTSLLLLTLILSQNHLYGQGPHEEPTVAVIRETLIEDFSSKVQNKIFEAFRHIDNTKSLTDIVQQLIATIDSWIEEGILSNQVTFEKIRNEALAPNMLKQIDENNYNLEKYDQYCDTLEEMYHDFIDYLKAREQNILQTFAAAGGGGGLPQAARMRDWRNPKVILALSTLSAGIAFASKEIYDLIEFIYNEQPAAPDVSLVCSLKQAHGQTYDFLALDTKNNQARATLLYDIKTNSYDINLPFQTAIEICVRSFTEQHPDKANLSEEEIQNLAMIALYYPLDLEKTPIRPWNTHFLIKLYSSLFGMQPAQKIVPNFKDPS
ncbi:MAG: hypothetical protein K2X39_08140 [Silvanigrellaceae bacterium]|nr:hypothetical protein [Silvanigrellaceae bacterium]